MLEYRQNINYYSSQSYNINEQLEQLAALLKHKDSADVEQLYDKIRSYIYKQIKIEQLAVTRVLNDLHTLRKTKPKTADVIEYYIANNADSYQQIANEFGCSKQNIYSIVQSNANNYTWLKGLMMVKGEYDSKNKNNRTIFYDDVVKDVEQMEMF